MKSLLQVLYKAQHRPATFAALLAKIFFKHHIKETNQCISASVGKVLGQDEELISEVGSLCVLIKNVYSHTQV